MAKKKSKDFQKLPVEERIKILWNKGWSRNTISKVVHVGHDKVQRIVEKLDRKKHETEKKLRLERYRKRYKELIEIDFPRKGTMHEIAERSKTGLMAQSDPEVYSQFVKGDSVYSP
jgi:hypothetical protein